MNVTVINNPNTLLSFTKKIKIRKRSSNSYHHLHHYYRHFSRKPESHDDKDCHQQDRQQKSYRTSRIEVGTTKNYVSYTKKKHKIKNKIAVFINIDN